MNFIDLKSQYARIRPYVDQRIAAVLEHGQYIMGPEVAEFEQLLAGYVGARHCVAVASGTDALQIALMALGTGAGDEVITAPFTFIATAEVIALTGARPVFVDIDERTYNLNPALLEAAITPRTKAIMPVSLYGQCADLDAINEIAARHDLPVIEDAAQSLGATYKGRKSGALSTIGATSFFPSKPLGGYGDGGALFTDNDELATAMREIRVHGQDRRYHHPRLGLTSRLDSLQAAVLLAKMEVFEDEVRARSEIGARYTHLMQAMAADSGASVLAPFVESFNTSVYAQYTIRVDERDAVASRLNSLGIPTAIHYPLPLHLQPVFSDLDQHEGSFPVAEAAALSVLSLPMHPYLPLDQQERVVAAVRQAVTG